MASLPRSSIVLSTPSPDGIGHVAICDIEHVRYASPYKRTYMRFVGANSLPDRKKPVAQRELRPRCRAFAARPRAATPYSRRPFAFGTRVTIVLLRAVYRTRVPSRGPGESIERSWRPRAKAIVAKGEGHDALGWRHGVGLLEKYSRPEASLFFGADIGGRVPIARRNAKARQR